MNKNDLLQFFDSKYIQGLLDFWGYTDEEREELLEELLKYFENSTELS